MSIPAYASAIRSANVLPAVLSRPIAEYARADDAYFAAQVLGRGTPIPPTYSFMTDIFEHMGRRSVAVTFAKYIWRGTDISFVQWHTPGAHVEIEFAVAGFARPLRMSGTCAYLIKSICAGRAVGDYDRLCATGMTELATQLFSLMRDEMLDLVEGREPGSSSSAKKMKK